MRERKTVNFGLEKFLNNNFTKRSNMGAGCQKNLICVRRAVRVQRGKRRRTLASGTLQGEVKEPS